MLSEANVALRFAAADVAAAAGVVEAAVALVWAAAHDDDDGDRSAKAAVSAVSEEWGV